MNLPSQFADLEEVAARWSKIKRVERVALHCKAQGSDIAELCSWVIPRLPEILEYFGCKSAAELTPVESNLFGLALMVAEVGPDYEVHGKAGMDRSLLSRLYCEDGS